MFLYKMITGVFFRCFCFNLLILREVKREAFEGMGVCSYYNGGENRN